MPIYKNSEDESLVTNYRSISKLSVVCKIFKVLFKIHYFFSSYIVASLLEVSNNHSEHLAILGSSKE